MIRKITNQALDYAWGSRTLIADYFGTAATGRPMAEIWFGTHAGSPAVAADDSSIKLLDLRQGKQLSFLMKILAAETPLSIQAHPNLAQAAEGFARENAAGIPVAASNRNYKDALHKPEMVVALTDFVALSGFKSESAIDSILETVGEFAATDELHERASAWRAELKANGIKGVFKKIIHARTEFGDYTHQLAGLANGDGRFELAAKLHELYPGDPGVLLALFLNQIYLSPGEGIFLPAGNIHAYLSGLGVEIMASSDNVLRGGLTPKHIDIDELERVAIFESAEVAKIQPKEILTGLYLYPADVDDFLLYRAELSGDVVLADLELPADSIVLCTAGEVAISNSIEQREVLRRSEAAYLAADAKKFSLAGSGTVFIAVGK